MLRLSVDVGVFGVLLFCSCSPGYPAYVSIGNPHARTRHPQRRNRRIDQHMAASTLPSHITFVPVLTRDGSMLSQVQNNIFTWWRGLFNWFNNGTNDQAVVTDDAAADIGNGSLRAARHQSWQDLDNLTKVGWLGPTRNTSRHAQVHAQV